MSADEGLRTETLEIKRQQMIETELDCLFHINVTTFVFAPLQYWRKKKQSDANLASCIGGRVDWCIPAYRVYNYL